VADVGLSRVLLSRVKYVGSIPTLGAILLVVCLSGCATAWQDIKDCRIRNFISPKFRCKFMGDMSIEECKLKYPFQCLEYKEEVKEKSGE
jgi:hypothetical protein